MCNRCNNALDNSEGLGGEKEVLYNLTKPISVDMGGTQFVIGYYPWINGEDSKSLQVTITIDEIKTIVREHMKMLRAIDECWADGQSGSWETRQYSYSNARVNYFVEFLGEEAIRKIYQEAYEGFDPTQQTKLTKEL